MRAPCTAILASMALLTALSSGAARAEGLSGILEKVSRATRKASRIIDIAKRALRVIRKLASGKGILRALGGVLGKYARKIPGIGRLLASTGVRQLIDDALHGKVKSFKDLGARLLEMAKKKLAATSVGKTLLSISGLVTRAVAFIKKAGPVFTSITKRLQNGMAAFFESVKAEAGPRVKQLIRGLVPKLQGWIAANVGALQRESLLAAAQGSTEIDAMAAKAGAELDAMAGDLDTPKKKEKALPAGAPPPTDRTPAPEPSTPPSPEPSDASPSPPSASSGATVPPLPPEPTPQALREAESEWATVQQILHRDRFERAEKLGRLLAFYRRFGTFPGYAGQIKAALAASPELAAAACKRGIRPACR